jgi:PGF-pre-PGF domain-containing protein
MKMRLKLVSLLFVTFFLLSLYIVNGEQIGSTSDASVLQIDNIIYVFGDGKWSDLEQVRSRLNNTSALSKSGTEYLLNANLYVNGTTTTFYINNSTCSWLKLNSTGKDIHYLRWDGILDIRNTKITSWNTTSNDVAPMIEQSFPRAYIYTQNPNARSYWINANISYLGYDNWKMYGIHIQNSHDNIFINCTFMENRYGIFFHDSYNNTLKGVTAISRNATDYGHGIFFRTEGSGIGNNILIDSVGISDNCSWWGHGIHLWKSYNNTLINCTGITYGAKDVGNIRGAGILGIYTNNSHFENCIGKSIQSYTQTESYGFMLEYTYNSTIINTTGYSYNASSSGHGLIIWESSNNTIRNSVGQSINCISYGAGIYIGWQNARGNYFYNVTGMNINSSLGYGIFIYNGTNDNVFESCDGIGSTFDYYIYKNNINNTILNMIDTSRTIRIDSNDCLVYFNFSDNRFFNENSQETAYWYPEVASLRLNGTIETVNMYTFNASAKPTKDYITLNILTWNTTGDYYKWITISTDDNIVTYKLKVNNINSDYILSTDKISNISIRSNSTGWLTFNWSDWLNGTKLFEIKRSDEPNPTPTPTPSSTPTALPSQSSGVESSSSGASGGSRSVATSEPYENIIAREISYIGNINPGDNIVKKLSNPEHGIAEVAFEYQTSTKETNIIIEKLRNRSVLINQTPFGVVYGYINIWVNVPSPKYLHNSSIKFYVDKSWIAENDIDPSKVALFQYINSSWTQLPTTLVYENESIAIYSSPTNGFSHFAIVGMKKEKIQKVNLVLNLHKGWNLISIPIYNESLTLESLNSISGYKIENISIFNKTSNSFEKYNLTAENYEIPLEPYGYMVYAKDDVQINIEGTMVEKESIELKKGWNLISLMGFEKFNLSEISEFLQTNAKYISMFNENKQEYEMWITNFNLKEDKFTIERDRTYLIYVDSDCRLELPKPIDIS